MEQCLRDIPDTQEKPGPQRSERELLTKILELLRNQTRARGVPTVWSGVGTPVTPPARNQMRMFEEVQQLLLRKRDTVNPDASGQALSLMDFAMLEQVGVIRAHFSDFAKRYEEVEKLLNASMARPYTPREIESLFQKLLSLRVDVGLAF